MSVEHRRWTLEFYSDARGKSPVLEFINGLPESERAKVYMGLRLLREFGAVLGMPHARPLTGHKPIWELRAGPIRVLYFARAGRRFILLHVFRKKTGETPKREIAAAERRMAAIMEGEE